MKKTLTIFLFIFSVLISFNSNASWKGSQRNLDCVRNFEDAQTQVDSWQYSNPVPYYVTSREVVTTGACGWGFDYRGKVTYRYWDNDSTPPDISEAGENIVYNHVYTDEQCQSLLGNNEKRVITGMPATFVGESYNAGSCSISPTTSSTCWESSDGSQKCLGKFEASSTGKTNQPSNSLPSSTPISDPAEELPDYLTPTDECSAYSCVTIDGQLYQVDQDAIPDNGSIDISQDSDTIQFYKGGGYKLTHPDGSYEIMDGQGNTTYHNADGSIDPNGGSDSGSDGGSDSGSDGGDSGSDGGGDSSGGGTTPGTGDGDSGGSGDGEGDSGDGDGDSTLGDVVGAIYNLKDSMNQGFDGLLDGARDYVDSMVEGIASSGPSGELTEEVGTKEENLNKATTALEGAQRDLTDLVDGSDSELKSLYDQMSTYFGEFFPQLPQTACTPLTFAPGAEYSFTIQCDVFEMIREALAWIFYALTVYFILSTMFSARPS